MKSIAVSPDIDDAARAIARRYRWRTVPDGAWAANLLGLSTQVPAKIVYLSDGPSKKILIGKTTIRFKHARPQVLAGVDENGGAVIQALRHIGKKSVDATVIQRLREVLPAQKRRALAKQARFGVDWIYQVAKEIAGVPR